MVDFNRSARREIFERIIFKDNTDYKKRIISIYEKLSGFGIKLPLQLLF